MYSISYVSVWKRTAPKEELKIAEAENSKIEIGETFYENDDTLKTYFKFHFEDQAILGVPNFPKTIGEFCVQMCNKFNIPLTKALDCGSGPGGTSFRLAQDFANVEAFDFS